MQVMCLFFGAERKWAANMMSWKSLFCYDNNKKHLIFHHPDKWKEYLSLSNDAEYMFFKGAVSFCNMLQSNFA